MLAYEFPASLGDAVVSGEVKNPYHLARGLVAQGHQVVVVSVPFLTRSASAAAVRPDSSPTVYDVPEGLARGAARYAWRIRNVDLFLRRYVGDRFDVVHAQAPALAAAAIRARASGAIPVKFKIITTAHGTNLPEANADRDNSIRQTFRRANARVEFMVDRRAFRSSDAVICVSEHQKHEMAALYKVDRDNVNMIHNGIDLGLYSPEIEPTNLLSDSWAPDDPVILFVGRLVPKKGLQHLIRALPKVVSAISNARCVVVGGSKAFDSFGSELHELAVRCGVNQSILWLDEVPERDLPAVYRRATVCVFPSVNYESLPTVTLEAMACGIPVIATKGWGTPEALGLDHPGYIREADSNDIARRIIDFVAGSDIADSARRQQFSKLADFDLRETVIRHELLYARICAV